MSGSRVGGTHGKHSIQKKKHDAARATETSARACPLMKLCRGFFVDRVELELGGDHGLQQSRVGSCCLVWRPAAPQRGSARQCAMVTTGSVGWRLAVVGGAHDVITFRIGFAVQIDAVDFVALSRHQRV